MVEIERTIQATRFEGDDIWFADTCEPLTQAVLQGDVAMAALARGHYPGHPLTDSMLPGPAHRRLLGCRRASNWGLQWHRNEGIEITYLERGLPRICCRWQILADLRWPDHCDSTMAGTLRWRPERCGLPPALVYSRCRRSPSKPDVALARLDPACARRSDSADSSLAAQRTPVCRQVGRSTRLLTNWPSL